MKAAKKKPNRDAFSLASEFHPAENFDLKTYLKRTRRNQFWIGGELGQHRLRAMKIAVAGLGGIGGNIADALARAGVGHLRIADLDQIDVSNINRQVVARTSTLGKNKAQQAAQDLRAIATDYELVVYDEGVNDPMVPEFVDGCNAIVDEIDVFALDKKLPLHREARARGIPLYTSYVVGLGVHFYKFHGNDYTIEDFLGVENGKLANPTAKFLMDRIGYPLPEYMTEAAIQGYETTIKNEGAPIFGPATLIGHAVVTARLLMDALGALPGTQGLESTPVMPEFLVLDLASLSIRKCRVPGT